MKSTSRYFAKKSSDVRAAKCRKSRLGNRVSVRIAVINRNAHSPDYQKGLEVSLKKNVDVNPFAEIAAISHVSDYRIENLRQHRCNASLRREPRMKIRQVVDARHCGTDLLIDLVRSEMAGMIPKL